LEGRPSRRLLCDDGILPISGNYPAGKIILDRFAISHLRCLNIRLTSFQPTTLKWGISAKWLKHHLPVNLV